jgi:hypothetical protein
LYVVGRAARAASGWFLFALANPNLNLAFFFNPPNPLGLAACYHSQMDFLDGRIPKLADDKQTPKGLKPPLSPSQPPLAPPATQQKPPPAMLYVSPLTALTMAIVSANV